MNTVDLIVKKRNGQTMEEEELVYLVEGYVKEAIPDYQMAAFLMAIYFQGMSEKETVALTRIMKESGDQIDLSSIHGKVVDKHSTGGVGDTTTLILGPWLAACGVPVAKMSGRGLGHTGGTIDKMESIPGFRTSLSVQEFLENVNKVGFALAGQTGSIAPADKKLYALRDVTGTVEQRSLIASSIMSKKLASGAAAILLDVKVGAGAFMKNVEEGVALAKIMVEIGTAMGRETVAVLSSMEQPLGNAVGNALEVMEAVKVLKGLEKGDLYQLTRTLAQEMLILADRCETTDQAELLLAEALNTGKAYEKFLEFVERQGGDVETLDKGLPLGKFHGVLRAKSQGVVTKIQGNEIGLAAMHGGAGRETKDASIDLGAGVLLNKRVGQRVYPDETLAEVYANDERKLSHALHLLENAIQIGEESVPAHPLILGKVKKDKVELYDNHIHTS